MTASNRDEILMAAEAAIGRGWSVIPVPHKSKNPNRTGWQDERWRLADLPQQFTEPNSNIGLLTGTPSGELIDIDVDCSRALAIAGFVLPETGAVFGRPGAPASHWLYTVTDEIEYMKFLDPLGSKKLATIIEIRGSGHQSVMPPSVHESGEQIAWVRNESPLILSAVELKGFVALIAAAALLARHWPAGARHDAALALSGGLYRARWDNTRIEEFMRHVVRAASDDELDDRLKAVATTINAIDSGTKASGFPTLARLTDPKIVDRLCEWLGISNASNTSTEESPPDSTDKADVAARAIPVPPFPVEVFPPRVQAFLERGAMAVGCPVDLVAVPFLIYAASAIGKTRELHIKKSWKLRPILWAGIVAVSGDGKSPADSYARAALDELQAEADERYAEQFDKYKQDLSRWKSSEPRDRKEEPSPPHYEHWYSTDATVESLAPMLQHNSGIVLSCDELVAWAKGCNQFKKGGNDRQKYLEIYNGRPLKVDRKTQGVIFVKAPVLGIVGGIQPARLAEMTNAESIHDGLLPRFLWSYPDVPPTEWTWEEHDVDDLPWMVGLFRQLRTQMYPLGPMILTPSKESRLLWKQWFDTNRASRDHLPQLAKEVVSKLPGQVARIWLVLETLWRPDELFHQASVSRLANALELVAYFQAHQRRVAVHFGTSAPNSESALVGRLRAMLERAFVSGENDGWVSRTEIWHHLKRSGTAEKLDAALQALLTSGQIEQREVATGTRPRTEWRLIPPVSSDASSEESDFEEDEEESSTEGFEESPARGERSNYSTEQSRMQFRKPTTCYACKSTRLYADGVCAQCHPRSWDTPVEVIS